MIRVLYPDASFRGEPDVERGAAGSGVHFEVYRRGGTAPPVPTCFAMAWTRPSSFGEARARERV